MTLNDCVTMVPCDCRLCANRMTLLPRPAKTGCSGFAYVINYADEVTPGDLMFEDRGVKVFVEPASLSLLDGTVVDFVKQGLNEAFRFRNPNVKGECGCGESFSV